MGFGSPLLYSEGGRFILARDGVYLLQNDLIGCQSHTNSSLKFRPGLNVIVARNNTGKSVFMKMLKLFAGKEAMDRDERKALITDGFECATSRYIFSDGSSTAVQVYENRVIFFYTDAIGEIPYTSSLTPPDEGIRKLGLIVDQKEGFIANILDQDQALLLVKSNSSTNNNLVKMVITDERADLLLQKFKEREIQYKEDKKRLDNYLYPLELRLERMHFIDLDFYENQINILEDVIEVWETLIEMGREVETLCKSVKDTVDYDLLIDCMDLAIVLEENAPNIRYIETVEVDLEIFDTLSSLVSVIPEAGLYVDESYISFLELAEQIAYLYEDVQALKVIEEGVDIMPVLDLCEEVASTYEQALVMTSSFERSIALSERIEELEESLADKGRSVECPIFGVIKHVSGECIPISS